MTPPCATLVVPCYNEETRLKPGEFLDSLVAQPRVGFLMVDDGSGDGTWTVLEEMRVHAPERITTLRLERNRGKAEAVRQGMLRAMEAVRSTDHVPYLVGYWDADLSTPLAAVPLFLEVFEEWPDCRLVMGSRVRLLGRRIVRRPLRHYLGRVFSTLASLALDLPIYDTQCGAKLFRADEDLQALLSTPFSDPWLFDVEILARLRALWGARAENRIVELPLPEWEDVGGSKIRLTDGLRALASLISIWGISVRGGGLDTAVPGYGPDLPFIGSRRRRPCHAKEPVSRKKRGCPP